jgi:hypothetical protein
MFHQFLHTTDRVGFYSFVINLVVKDLTGLIGFMVNQIVRANLDTCPQATLRRPVRSRS